MEQKMESDLGKLFIGGISWDTDEEGLREYFGKYGDVVEAVIMRDRATGRARGFGFIVFADPSVAERVIMDSHIIDGRKVEAKKAVPRDGQQALIRQASPMHLISPSHGGNGSMIRTKKIFVGGLPASITEVDFKNYFDQFGTVTDVVVMYDHLTQRPRGFGFITFDSEESVDMVLHKTFHQLNGKMVEVKRAVPKEISSTPNRSPLHGLGINFGMVSNRPYADSYFNSFPPGYNANNLASAGRFSPMGTSNPAFSSFGLGLNQELNLNSTFDGNILGNTLGYGRIRGNQFASTDRFNSPIGYNRGESAYNPSSRHLLGTRSDASGLGLNLGVSVGNNRGNWGLSSGLNDTNSYGRNYETGSGLPGLSFSGNTNRFDGSIGELYRGGSVFSDSTWQQTMPFNQSSNELDGLSSSFGFSIDNVGSDSDPSATNVSEGFLGNYNVGNRQTDRVSGI